MNSEYHTMRSRSQSTASAFPLPLPANGRHLRTSTSRPLRIPVAVLPTHPLLVGDRDMLRKLRAAEMAAWEAVKPNSTVEPTLDGRRSRSEPRSSTRAGKFRLWLWLFLAACGTVAVSLDLQDFSLFHAGWSELVGGLRRLFA